MDAIAHRGEYHVETSGHLAERRTHARRGRRLVDRFHDLRGYEITSPADIESVWIVF